MNGAPGSRDFLVVNGHLSEFGFQVARISGARLPVI
jgi:hypothetical protein